VYRAALPHQDSPGHRRHCPLTMIRPHAMFFHE
jgi:hypothetical protein